MWAARTILFPVAALTFFFVYAPWAIPFLLLSSLLVTVALFTAGRKGREPMRVSLARQKGSVLLGLIAAMVVMATLGAAMVPMFSASYMNQAGADQGRKAYFLAESGFRYAASQFLNASSEAAKQTALTNVNNKTCNLLNNGGSFTTIVYPFWTVTQSTAGTTLTTQLFGTIPGELSTGTGGYFKVGSNTFYSYSTRSGSGTTVTFTGISPATPPAAGQDLLPVVLASSGTTVSNGGSLTLSGTGADAFPPLNGNFTLYPTPAGLTGGIVFNYEKKVGSTLQNITLADPTKTWINFTVTSGVITNPNTTKIILDKHLRVSSTGNYAGSSRQIVYNAPIGWMAGGGQFQKQQFHDQFNNDAAWYTAQGLGGHSVSAGAMNVTSVVDPTTTGSGLLDFLLGLFGWGSDGLWAFNAWNWATTNTNLAQAWHDAGGNLSYDLQIKMNNTQPYWMGGVGFRLRNNSDNSDVHTYGLSFTRQRQTSTCFLWSCTAFGNNDGIHPDLRPFGNYSASHFISGSSFWGTQARYSDPGIVLWQRNGPATGTGSFKVLAYRTITAADNLTTGTGVDMRLKAWSSLMVRLLEGYELQFNLGRVDASDRHIKYGDTIRNSDGSKTARVIGSPIMTTAWGGTGTTVGAGRFILTNVTGGGFSSGEDLYLDGGTADAYARANAAQAATKANYIMVYTSDDRSPAGAGDTIQANEVRIGNLRDSANWPPDNWTDRTAANDYFTLVQWYTAGMGLGSEMAPALTSGNWTTGTNWTIASNELQKDSNGTGTARPNPALTITSGVTYAVSISVIRTAGSFTYSLGGVTSSSINATGTYTADITATSSGNLIFTPTNSSRFRITAVSVRPYVAMNVPTLDTTPDGQGNVASYVDAVTSSDFHWAVIKTAALRSPTWTSSSTVADFATPGDHIAIVTSSSAGTSTSYDDFAVQLDTKSGTGFLPPIQQ
jgi:Tfp pilus assembly protein PilX